MAIWKLHKALHAIQANKDFENFNIILSIWAHPI